jgi:hypothetical protein
MSAASSARKFLSALLLVAMVGAACAQPASPPTGKIGANKLDLFSQYLGTASGGNGSASYRYVTRAMAIKALDDARDAGIPYLRVSLLPGEAGRDKSRDSLELWKSDPASYWRAMDQMMSDLDARGIRMIPVIAAARYKFPLTENESLRDMIANPSSRSALLAGKFASEFAARYAGRKTIVFYDLTNELNNFADIKAGQAACARLDNKQARCDALGNFSTEEMLGFVRRLAAQVRSGDPRAKISSGFSIPRPAAERLRRSPAFGAARAEGGKDSKEDFFAIMRALHKDMDIVSVHVYGGPKNQRFDASALDLLADVKQVASAMGKPVFVGEFGYRHSAQSTAQLRAFMRKITELRIEYSAVWAWEFFQKNTYEVHATKPSNFSLEPGITDASIRELALANGVTWPPAGTARDAEKPRIVLVWPLPCAQVAGKVDLRAVASDNSGRVRSVDFLVDGAVVGSDAEAPFRAEVAEGALRPGLRRIQVRATDVAGNVGEFSTEVVAGRGSAACSVPQ